MRPLANYIKANVISSEHILKPYECLVEAWVCQYCGKLMPKTTDAKGKVRIPKRCNGCNVEQWREKPQ